MQFVARQLDLMNQGISKREAFSRTEEWFLERRRHLEREQKVLMALARDAQVAPMFTSAHAYWHAEVAKTEQSHLERILAGLRQVKDTKDELGRPIPMTVRERRERARVDIYGKKKQDGKDGTETIRQRLLGALPRAEGEVAEIEPAGDLGDEMADEPFAGADAGDLDEAVPALRRPLPVAQSLPSDTFDTTGDLEEDRGERPSGPRAPEQSLTFASDERGEPSSRGAVSMGDVRATTAQDVPGSRLAFGRGSDEGDETTLREINRDRARRRKQRERDREKGEEDP
jgi:hypothetical protein